MNSIAAPTDARPPEPASAAPNDRAHLFGSFAWWVLGVTLMVVVWGAYVRASGSGAGCGNHWPTCDGEVLPRPKSVAMAIEFAHRASSGLVLLLTGVELLWSRRAFARGHRVRRAAAAAMIFMLGEALIGAGLVLFELVAHDASLARAASMGAHLINTFFLLGSMTLAAFWSRSSPPSSERPARIPGSFVLALAAVVAVGATGGVAALGDTLFPASSLAQGMAQDLSPTAHVLLRLRVFHPLLAAAAGLYLFSLAGNAWARGRSPLERGLAPALGGVVLVQLAVGLSSLVLLAPIPLQLVHLLLADAVWIALVLLAAAVTDGNRSAAVDSGVDRDAELLP